MDIERDIASLREQLKKPHTIGVKRAIENEIERLEKKMTGRGKDRKAKTADGKMVGIGASVFAYSLPYLYDDGDERPASITEKRIEEISRIGRARFTGQYNFTDLAGHRYYSSLEAAHQAMIREAQLDVKTALRNVGISKNRVKRAKAVVEKAKAFNPNPAPAKKPARKRAA